MKKLRKNLFGIGLAFSLILGVVFSLVPNDAEAYEQEGWDDWKSTTVECTYSVTVTYGGGPIPFSYEVTTSYEGTMRRCVSGWGVCAWNGSCS